MEYTPTGKCLSETLLAAGCVCAASAQRPNPAVAEGRVSPGVSLVPMPAQIEESGTRFLLPRTLAMDAKDGIAAARQGTDVIMTPCDCFYLEYYQTPDPEADGEALAIGGCVTLEKCCSFDTAAGIDAEDQHYMKGVQANTWTEFMPDFDHVQHMILPRIAAAAEIGWTPRKSEYVDFRERVRRGLLPLKGGKWKGCFHVPHGLYQLWQILEQCK